MQCSGTDWGVRDTGGAGFSNHHDISGRTCVLYVPPRRRMSQPAAVMSITALFRAHAHYHTAARCDVQTRRRAEETRRAVDANALLHRRR
jgi:hypothetical protein